MSRIEADQLAREAREAIVYVRESTIDQVMNNVESRPRLYGLVERARQLGWANVSGVDDDLGRSGSGASRPGFEKPLVAICEGRYWRGGVDQGVAPGSQRTRLAHAAGVLRPRRDADRR
jgi:hypothetical protein